MLLKKIVFIFIVSFCFFPFMAATTPEAVSQVSTISATTPEVMSQIPTKKLLCGFEMPVFGCGTFLMGGVIEPDAKNNDAADITALAAALDRGVTHFDTAELYAGGHAEELLGQAIKGRDRATLFIVSKVRAKNMGYEGTIAACKRSLERLGTPYLDLYLLHSYSPEVDLKGTMKALDVLILEKKIKNIGVSNFTKEALILAQSYTKNKIVCNQVHYNLQVRQAERNELLLYCQENDVMLVAWRPLHAFIHSFAFDKGASLPIQKEVPLIVLQMAEKYKKTPMQIVLNWLISQKNVAVITQSCTIEHLEENLGACGWVMESEDIEKLRTEYPNKLDVSPVFALNGPVK